MSADTKNDVLPPFPSSLSSPPASIPSSTFSRILKQYNEKFIKQQQWVPPTQTIPNNNDIHTEITLNRNGNGAATPHKKVSASQSARRPFSHSLKSMRPANHTKTAQNKGKVVHSTPRLRARSASPDTRIWTPPPGKSSKGNRMSHTHNGGKSLFESTDTNFLKSSNVSFSHDVSTDLLAYDGPSVAELRMASGLNKRGSLRDKEAEHVDKYLLDINYHKLNEKFKQSQLRLSGQSNSILNLQQALKAKNKELKGKEKTIMKLNEIISQLRNEAGNNNHADSAPSAVVSRLEKDLKSLSNKLEESKLERKRLSEHNANMFNKLKTKTQELDALQVAMQTKQSEDSIQVNKLKEKVKHLKVELDSKKNELSLFSQQLQEKQANSMNKKEKKLRELIVLIKMKHSHQFQRYSNILTIMAKTIEKHLNGENKDKDKANEAHSQFRTEMLKQISNIDDPQKINQPAIHSDEQLLREKRKNKRNKANKEASGKNNNTQQSPNKQIVNEWNNHNMQSSAATEAALASTALSSYPREMSPSLPLPSMSDEQRLLSVLQNKIDQLRSGK